MKPSSIACSLVLALSCAGAVAASPKTCTGPLVGTWVLLSMETEDQQTNDKNNLLGVHPSGSLTYGADCRMYAILVKESREHPADTVASDAESIDLYRSLITYAGTYSVDGSRIIHQIQVAWNQSWAGTTQIQHFRINENTLFVNTESEKNPLTGKRSTTAFIWTRAD